MNGSVTDHSERGEEEDCEQGDKEQLTVWAYQRPNKWHQKRQRRTTTDHADGQLSNFKMIEGRTCRAAVVVEGQRRCEGQSKQLQVGAFHYFSGEGEWKRNLDNILIQSSSYNIPTRCRWSNNEYRSWYNRLTVDWPFTGQVDRVQEGDCLMMVIERINCD
jgi:hypothetical protein